MHKVTNRVRQIVIARNQPALPAEQVAILEETLEREREHMKDLFATVQDALIGVSSGTVDEMAESRNQDTEGETLLRGWGDRWLRVFRRKMAVEESWIGEMMTIYEAMDAEVEATAKVSNGDRAQEKDVDNGIS